MLTKSNGSEDAREGFAVTTCVVNYGAQVFITLAVDSCRWLN